MGFYTILVPIISKPYISLGTVTLSLGNPYFQSYMIYIFFKNISAVPGCSTFPRTPALTGRIVNSPTPELALISKTAPLAHTADSHKLLEASFLKRALCVHVLMHARHSVSMSLCKLGTLCPCSHAS